MGAPAAVGVDDDLTSSEASVCIRATSVKLTRRVNYDFSVLKHVLRDDLFDDLLC